MKKKLLQYGICFLIGAALALWVMYSEGLFIPNNPVDVPAVLCDAFFVPGILMVMVGALLWISTTGLFDALGYAFRVAGHNLLPFLFKKDIDSFYDYKTEKDGKRMKTPVFIFIVGVVFLVASGIALAVYYLK
ncbi:MAG: DUF3899 domain-containing protein [Clostridia bacterium]|nr:DUF3899 domain-containing protein [Clostridia bacterium]